LQDDPFPKILLLGEKGHGKTLLLYKLQMKESYPNSLKIAPTQGINFEIIKNNLSDKIGILEIGGSQFVSLFSFSKIILEDQWNSRYFRQEF